MRPKSVLMGLDQEAIQTLLSIHCESSNPKILDVTYNKGVMWKNTDFKPTRMDIDSTLDVDIVGDFCNMPIQDQSYDVIVFDPPFLPSDIGKNSIFKTKYNTDKFDDNRKKENVSAIFPLFLKEAKRVLVSGGIILAKLADIVHNHRYQWHLVDFINAVREAEMTPCDLLIKCDPKAGNLQSSKWKSIKHLRKCHCYWIVVRNSKKCECKGKL